MVNRYRTIDLSLFMVILAVFETVIVLAAVRWFSREAWTVTAVSAITAIVMVRWKGYAAIQAIAGAMALCIGLGANPKRWVIYCVGNLFFAVAFFFLKLAGEKRIRENSAWTILFGAFTLLMMQTGRAAVAMIFGGSLREAVAFYATDSLSYVFTTVILWIAKRLDGIFEDQKTYLARLHEQMEAEKEEIQ